MLMPMAASMRIWKALRPEKMGVIAAKENDMRTGTHKLAYLPMDPSRAAPTVPTIQVMITTHTMPTPQSMFSVPRRGYMKVTPASPPGLPPMRDDRFCQPSPKMRLKSCTP